MIYKKLNKNNLPVSPILVFFNINKLILDIANSIFDISKYIFENVNLFFMSKIYLLVSINPKHLSTSLNEFYY